MQPVRGRESVQPLRRERVQPLCRERVQSVQSLCGFGVQPLRGDVELGRSPGNAAFALPPPRGGVFLGGGGGGAYPRAARTSAILLSTEIS